MAELFPDGPPANAIGLAMEKHGLAVWGETARECYERLTSVIQKAEAYVAGRRDAVEAVAYVAGRRGGVETFRRNVSTAEARTDPATLAPIIRGELTLPVGQDPSPGTDWRPILTFDDSPETLDRIANPNFPEIGARGVMTPEHIMRAGRRAMIIPLWGSGSQPDDEGLGDAIRTAIRDARTHYLEYAARQKQPNPIPDWLKVIAVPGAGIFYAGKDRRNALIARDCYNATMEAMAGAEAVERFEPISEADACEMEYWPLERRKIEASAAARKDLDGKIALVIGAASGIGRATALRFAAEGAHVAVADLNLDGAQEVAGEIRGGPRVSPGGERRR